MKSSMMILLAGPSLFVLATAAAAQPAPATPPVVVVDEAADPGTQAQQANEALTNDDEAIIVTARRRAENLLDVPQTVNAVTGKQLQEYNLTQFQDISQLVPGLNLTNDNSGFGAQASTRGVTFSVSSQGSPTVETYINEHWVDPNLMFQGQFDVGQIEVIKGPQGVQRGRSSPSGAMTLTTRRPDLNEVGGAVSALATHRGNMNYTAALGVPIINDVLAVRVAGLYDISDQGGVKSAITHQEPWGKTWALRGTLRFEPTDSLSMVIMGQHMDKHTKTFGGQVFGPGAVGINRAATAGGLSDNLLIANTTASPFQSCAPVGVGTCAVLPGGVPRIVAEPSFNGPVLDGQDYLSVQDFPNLVHNIMDVVTGQVDWLFGGQKLSYVTGYSYYLLDGRGGGGDASNTVVGHQAQPLYLGNLAKDYRWSNEMRLVSDERLFDMLDYTLGLYYGRRHGTTSSPTGQMWAGAFGSPLGASAPTGSGLLTPTQMDTRYGLDTDRFAVNKYREKAIFVDLIGHFFDDRLELEAGGRQMWFAIGKSQENRFSRGLMALRNPNATALNPNAACPSTLSGVNNAGQTFINAQVVGSTYAGTCDVQMTVGNGINQGQFFPFSTRKWNPFVYKVAASFKITPDHMIYANYGTAWRSGPGPITGIASCAASLTPGFPEPGLCDRFNFLDPDKTKGGEIGYKGSFFDNKLSTTIALYKQDFSGMFVFGTAVEVIGTCVYPHVPNVTLQPTSGCSVLNNQLAWFNAPVKTKGIDADFNFRLNEDLNFGGAASWSDSKFGSALIPCADSNWDGVPDGGVAAGTTVTQYFNSIPAAQLVNGAVPTSAYGYSLCNTATNPALKPNNSPKWNFNLHAEYSHDVFTGGRAFIRALYNYTPVNKNLNPNPLVNYIPKAYGILNMFVGLRGDEGDWEVTLAMRNLLDNKTRLTQAVRQTQLSRPPGAATDTLSFTSAAAANSAGYTTTSFVTRREFQLSARFAFGSR